MFEVTPEMEATFGKGVSAIAALYAPAVGRLAVQELSTYITLLADKKAAEARNLARTKMNVDELGAEKTLLTGTAWAMAEGNAARHDLANEIILAALKVAAVFGTAFMGFL